MFRQKIPARRNDANLVILYTNARDENKILEWIAHHLLLGFDKIIIFDHLSKIPINKLLNNAFGSKVEIIRVSGNGNIKLSLMRQAVNLSKILNASWMLYLDADEFLYLKYALNVKQMLNRFYFADQLAINWLMFGTSNHIRQPEGLLTENFIKSSKMLDQHVKVFVRPNQVINVINPHWYNIYDNNRFICVTGNKMIPGPFNKNILNNKNVIAYIAHYCIQSEATYIKRKNRIQDDGTTRNNISNLHELYNEEQNLDLKNKYSENIKKYLLKVGIIM